MNTRNNEFLVCLQKQSVSDHSGRKHLNSGSRAMLCKTGKMNFQSIAFCSGREKDHSQHGAANSQRVKDDFQRKKSNSPREMIRSGHGKDKFQHHTRSSGQVKDKFQRENSNSRQGKMNIGYQLGMSKKEFRRGMTDVILSAVEGRISVCGFECVWV